MKIYLMAVAAFVLLWSLIATGASAINHGVSSVGHAHELTGDVK